MARQHVAGDSVRWPSATRQLANAKLMWLVILVLGPVGLGIAFVIATDRLGTETTHETQVAYALLMDDAMSEQTNSAEVIAFDETSGDIITRLTAGDQPNVLPHPVEDKIHLLETRWDKLDWPSHGTEVLSIIDTHSWEVTASTTKELDSTAVANRVQYTLGGPPVMVLSPDASRLLVYSTNMQGDYWLESYDAATLDRLMTPDRITLPRGCGGTSLVTTGTELVMLCGVTKEGSDAEGMIATPLAIHFIDVNTGQITASISLPDSGLYVKGKPVDMVATGDGATIYVVFNDLRIMEIDTALHQVTRDISTWQCEEPCVFAVELSSDNYLLVGQSSDLTYWKDLALLRFSLPSLEPGDPLPVQEHPRFAAGPNGDIYQWERGTTELRQLDLGDGSVMDILLGGGKH